MFGLLAYDEDGKDLLAWKNLSTPENPIEGIMTGLKAFGALDAVSGIRLGTTVAAKSVEHGLLVRALPFIEVLAFSPPLCITSADCEEAIDRFARALNAATSELDRHAAGY